jgi:hypothetical protein
MNPNINAIALSMMYQQGQVQMQGHTQAQGQGQGQGYGHPQPMSSSSGATSSAGPHRHTGNAQYKQQHYQHHQPHQPYPQYSHQQQAPQQQYPQYQQPISPYPQFYPTAQSPAHAYAYSGLPSHQSSPPYAIGSYGGGYPQTVAAPTQPFPAHQQLHGLSYQQLLAMAANPVPMGSPATASVPAQQPFYPMGASGGGGVVGGGSYPGVRSQQNKYGASGPNKRGPIVAPPTEPGVVHYCESCDKEFAQLSAYQTHLNTHEPCSHPGCTFSGSKKVCSST